MWVINTHAANVNTLVCFHPLISAEEVWTLGKLGKWGGGHVLSAFRKHVGFKSQDQDQNDFILAFITETASYLPNIHSTFTHSNLSFSQLAVSPDKYLYFSASLGWSMRLSWSRWLGFQKGCLMQTHSGEGYTFLALPFLYLFLTEI